MADSLILLGLIVVIGWGLGIWHSAKGLPIPWQEYLERTRRSFNKKEQEYEVAIQVSYKDSTYSDYYSWRYGVIVKRKEGDLVYQGKDYGQGQTQNLAFSRAVRAARDIIKRDLKARKPKIEKTFQF